MESSTEISTIDLTLSTSDEQEAMTTVENDETFSIARNKIGRQGLEQYFKHYKEFITGEHKGKTSAVCTLCEEIIWHLRNSTSNYSRHLQRKHKVEFDSWSKAIIKEKKVNKNNSMKQTSIVSSLSPSSTLAHYGPTHPRQVELANMVFRDFVIELALPLSIVERPAFIRAMTTVDPKFRVPCRRALTYDYLPKAYDQINTKIKDLCSSTKYVSLTFDGWTDRRLRAFCAFTIHYIDEIGQLKSHLLSFNSLSGGHTGDNLFTQFDNVTTTFALGNKIVRLITDNASNNLSAFGDLVIPGFESYFITEDDDDEGDYDTYDINLNATEEQCSNDEDVQNDFDKGELMRLPCFIHTLQLVVKDGLNETGCMRSTMVKVAAIAKLSHQSISVAEKLQQNKFSIPQAVITRWNSQYLTVSSILDIPNTILNNILIEQNKNELLLSLKDLAILREFISIFALFAEATIQTQGEQCVSISLVAPSILGIYCDLENESQSCKYANSLCQQLMKSLKERFGGLLVHLEIAIDGHINQKNTFNLFSDEIFLISSFLDGRFRLRWILQSSLSEDVKNRVCEKIKLMVVQAALHLHDITVDDQVDGDALAELKTTIADHSSLAIKSSGDSGSTLKRKSLFAYCDTTDVIPKKQRVNIKDEINEEILLFLKDTSYEANLIFMKKHNFPHLHRLATRVLCVPASSAPVERIFSKSGLLMRPHRSRLTKDTLCKLTFVQCNMDIIT